MCNNSIYYAFYVIFDKKREKVYAFSSKSGVFISNVKDICTKNYAYRLDYAPDGYVDYIEDMFGQKIEPVYHHLLSAVMKKQHLANADIADLSLFIALQHLRIPRSLQHHGRLQSTVWRGFLKEQIKSLHDGPTRKEFWESFKSRYPAYYQQALRRYPEWEDELPDEFVDDILEKIGEKLLIDPGKNNILVSMLHATIPLADLFIRRSWEFFFAPKGSSFLTCDSTAFAYIPTRKGGIYPQYGGFGRTDAMIILPMSAKVCAIISNTEYNQRFTKATKRKVSEINRIIASKPALTHLISSSERLVNKYSKYQSSTEMMRVVLD